MPFWTEPDGIGDCSDGDLRSPVVTAMLEPRQARQPVPATRPICEMAEGSGQGEVHLPGGMDPDSGVAPARIRLAIGLKKPPGRLPALPPLGFGKLGGLQVVTGGEESMSTTDDLQVPKV
jgi:hypothetical protein